MADIAVERSSPLVMAIPIVLRSLRALVEPEAVAVDTPAGQDGAAVRAKYGSFEDLYEAAFPKVYTFLRCQVATTETAQDLISRVFLKAYQHYDKAPSDDGAMQWVFRIAHTTLIDYWRVDKRRERASLPIQEIGELPSQSTSAEAAYERKRQLSDLLQIVGDLAPDDRELLALKFAAHRTNREIAVIVNLSEGAVGMRLIRSLRRLRERLQSMGWE